MNILSDFRAKHKLSQAAMAQLLGITQTQYSRIEAGERGPSHDTFWRFEVVMGRKLRPEEFPALQEPYQGVMHEAAEIRQQFKQAVREARQ
jgi:transcriptional regulator with XRE-family HTH domain